MSRLSVLALVLAGCAPVVAWHGRSPDAAHRVRVIDEGDRQRLEVDERTLGEWDAVGLGHLAWTTRGVVVPVREGESWRVYQAGSLGPVHDAIGALETAGDRVVYVALEPDGWRVVVDGEPGPRFDSIRARSIVLAPDRVAYVARDASGEHAVIDDVVGPAYEHVEGLGFAGKGRLSAYAAYDADGARLVIDGAPGPRFGDVLELVLAPEEPRWAAIVESGNRLLVLHDGSSLGAHEGARELVTSADGARVAWLSAPSGSEPTRLFVDGHPIEATGRLEQVRFVPRTNALLHVESSPPGARVVCEGRAGPRFDEVDPLVVSDAGHWGYTAHRRGAGSAVVIDGAPRFRGEWAGHLALAWRGARWAFVGKHADRRFVVTPDGRVEVPRPFVDTLVVDAEARHWAIAVAEREARRLRVIVDGEDVAPLDLDEVAAELARGRDPAEATRAIVLSELRRAMAE